MRDPRLPKTIDRFEVQDDGVLVLAGMTCFPWINDSGFLGGTARYKLVAEEVPREEIFATTQETQ